MIVKKLWGLILSFLLCLQLGLATGPSIITSELVPLAINEKGDVLCKSRYSENRTGSHSHTATNYGLCMVKNGEVNPIPESDIHFAPDFSSPDYDEEFTAMQAQFDAITFVSDDLLVEDFYEDLLAEGFQKIELQDYVLEPQFSIDSFQKRWRVDYLQLPQVVLYNRELPKVYGDYEGSTEFLKVHLLYQINNQIWIEYEDCPLDLSVDCDQYDTISPDFYYADYGDEEEVSEDFEPMGYEWKQKVTSVIFLPEA